MYVWVSQVVSFLQGSSSKPFIWPSSLTYAPHAPPILSFSILSPEQYLVSSTDHSVPDYAVSSTTLLPRSVDLTYLLVTDVVWPVFCCCFKDRCCGWKFRVFAPSSFL
jgi:hypothetical protein